MHLFTLTVLVILFGAATCRNQTKFDIQKSPINKRNLVVPLIISTCIEYIKPIVATFIPKIISGPPTTTTRKLNYTSENISFTVSANDLPSKDKEAYAYITLTSISDQEKNIEFGKSDSVVYSKNPVFKEDFWFMWKNGTGQKWNIEIKNNIFIDIGNFRNNKIGDVSVDVDEFVGKGFSSYEISPQPGTLTLTLTFPVAFRLYARNVPKKDQFGRGASDVFVNVYWKNGENGEKMKFQTTSVIENTENPDWPDRIEFPNYVKGTDQYWVFKIKDKDTLRDDVIAEVQVKVDPFVEKRQIQIIKLEGIATLTITPA